MGIQLTEAGYFDLKAHIGHKIVVVGYGNPEEAPVNVSVECETCGEVIIDLEQPWFDENGICEECGCETYMDEEGDCDIFCINESCEHAKPDWGSIGPPD